MMDFLIATPVLNGVGFISECLDSVATAFRDFEYLHVVVDGGSLDGTLELLRERSGTRLRVVEAPGTSMFQALNIAIRVRSSCLFYQLNADDLILPGAPRRVWHIFEQSPNLVMLTGACLTIDMRSGTCKVKFPLGDQWSVKRIGVNLFISQPSTFVRHAALIAENGFHESYQYAGDTELWLRLIEHGYSGIAVTDLLSVDRLHGGSARLSPKHDEELAHVRRRYGGALASSRVQLFRNSMAYAVHNVICLGRGLGPCGNAVRYVGSPIRRMISFLFSGAASIELAESGGSIHIPIKGRIV